MSVRQGKATATVFVLISSTSGMRTAFEMASLGMSAAKARIDELVAAFAPETGVQPAPPDT